MKSLIAASLLLGGVASLSGCVNLSPDEMIAMRVMSGAEAPQPASTPSAQAAAAPQASGKTRAEVYQELVEAEKNGEVESLNATVYAH
ncbi:MAG: DUF4148 domain-containing protein [Pararobbsia sp.]